MEFLMCRAKYALNSHSRDLVYEAYGMAQMARMLGAIDRAQMRQINQMLVVDGINNPDCHLE